VRFWQVSREIFMNWKNFSPFFSLQFVQYDEVVSAPPPGAYPGGDLGVKTLPSTEIFFNLLGFFEKKIPKHLPKFWRPYRYISKHQ